MRPLRKTDLPFAQAASTSPARIGRWTCPFPRSTSWGGESPLMRRPFGRTLTFTAPRGMIALEFILPGSTGTLKITEGNSLDFLSWGGSWISNSMTDSWDRIASSYVADRMPSAFSFFESVDCLQKARSRFPDAKCPTALNPYFPLRDESFSVTGAWRNDSKCRRSRASRIFSKVAGCNSQSISFLLSA